LMLALVQLLALGTNVNIGTWGDLNTQIQSQLRFYGDRPLIQLGYGTYWTEPTELDFQYYLAPSLDMSGFAPIHIIEKEVNIHGGGQELDAAQLGHFFDLRNGSVLRLYNITLKNGKNAGNGGAIAMADSSLEATDVSFRENEAEAGGALFSDSSNAIKFTNTQFWTNKGLSERGGALRIEGGGHLSLKNCVFRDNTALHLMKHGLWSAGNGNAVWAEGCHVAVEDEITDFKDNQAYRGRFVVD